MYQWNASTMMKACTWLWSSQRTVHTLSASFTSASICISTGCTYMLLAPSLRARALVSFCAFSRFFSRVVSASKAYKKFDVRSSEVCLAENWVGQIRCLVAHCWRSCLALQPSVGMMGHIHTIIWGDNTKLRVVFQCTWSTDAFSPGKASRSVVLMLITCTTPLLDPLARYLPLGWLRMVVSGSSVTCHQDTCANKLCCKRPYVGNKRPR